MKYAWVENNRIRDLVKDPFKQFHPDVAKHYSTEVNDDVEIGYILVLGKWVAPEKPIVQPVIDMLINVDMPQAVRAGVSVAITVKVINAVDDSQLDVTKTFYIPVVNAITGEQESILQLDLLAGAGVITHTFLKPGIYTIREDLIRPVPKARMEGLIDIVATE